MKKYCIISFILCCYIYGCSVKCDHSTPSYIAAQYKQYFNSLKEGSWWVYKNSRLNKKDSVYISYFKSGFSEGNFDARSQSDCNRNEYASGSIVSKELFQNLRVNYSCLGLAESTFLRFDSPDASGAEFAINYDIKHSLFTGIIVKDTSLNQILYSNVLIVSELGNKSPFFANKYFFASNIGLVRWENKIDTFNIETYKIK